MSADPGVRRLGPFTAAWAIASALLLLTGRILAASPATGPLRTSPANPHLVGMRSGGCGDSDDTLRLFGGPADWSSASPTRDDYKANLPPSTGAKVVPSDTDHLWGLGGSSEWIWEGFLGGSEPPYPPSRILSGITWHWDTYFDRMRRRIVAARDRGIYASVMLFNGFSIEGKGNNGGDPWQGHPLNPKNNIGGLDGGGAVHTLSHPAVTAFQEAYVRKVIDTVNDLDNVLYEITNEDTASAAEIAWQFHMIRFIKSCEAAKPRQHPVGMTVPWPGGDDDVLLQSPADWISPRAKLPEVYGRKVILNDTDHSYFWISLKADGIAAQRAWVWENFTRGNQCLFMDPYLDPRHDPGRNNPVGHRPDPYWDPLRDAMGATRRLAERMNLATMTPRPELASTKFCLADPGREYLIYVPQGGKVTVDLSAASGEVNAAWFLPSRGNFVRAESTRGGSQRALKAPFTGDAVLHLWEK